MNQVFAGPGGYAASRDATIHRRRRTPGSPQGGGLRLLGLWLEADVEAMEPLRILAETRGFFSRVDALDCGLTDKDLAEGIRVSLLRRVRRGAYTYVDLWDGADPEARHLMRSSAVLHALGDDVVLSHTSAAVLHGIELWNADLTNVHVTRLGKASGRIEAGVVVHKGKCEDGEIVTQRDLRSVVAERAVLEAASLAPAESALVALDSYLHQGMGEYDALFARFEAMAHWPKTQHLHIPVRMASGSRESVGESRCIWTFRQQHLPAPVCQFKIFDRDGVLVAIADFAWPEAGVVVEFDGRIKYGRLVEPGQEAGDVLFAEKRREDLIRELTGMAVVRLVWDDLQRPRLIAKRIRQAMAPKAS